MSTSAPKNGVKASTKSKRLSVNGSRREQSELHAPNMRRFGVLTVLEIAIVPSRTRNATELRF